MASQSLLELVVQRFLYGLKNFPFPFADFLLVWVFVLIPRMIFFANYDTRLSDIPFVNNRKWYEIGYFKAKSRFLANAATLIKSGFDQGDVFRMVMDNGVIMVLHPKFANQIRTIEGLSFSESLAEDFHAQIPGFDPFTSEKLIHDVIKTKLKHVVKPLSEETLMALEEWPIGFDDGREFPLRKNVLELVARLTSKTLLGSEIGRNPAWHKIMVNYTVDAFVAAYILRLFPKFLRPLVSKFIPQCRKLRNELAEARRIIDPVLGSREKERVPIGELPNAVVEDGFVWLEQCANGRVYDPVIAQLSLSVVAIHTTSDMLTQVLFDIAERPELISALRKEIIQVFDNDRVYLTRGNLQQLKLMDSVLKESQRLKPVNIVSMRRRANYNIRLSDGTLIPKGTMICVSNHWMWDSVIYRNPEKFDAFRFYKKSGIMSYDFASKFVSPSPEHLGFGLGRHVCPGRFFAATEIKIILCHILLRYKIQLAPASKPEIMKVGAALGANLDANVLLKRRWQEVVLR
ncbi:cytochrome P450 [Aspergillus affinis]|uniref:cytochrome P450 n=1 Tax=Aspergillus affinis TaxID=1070780 RepID=UPI0022FF237D|nr:cytochrome P450 [Aspergillus affinis]KAI9035948.1 cytochrome P450 [Aspergillus affinis]